MRARFSDTESIERRLDRDVEREGSLARVYHPRNRLRPLRSRLFYTCCETWGECTCAEAA